MIHRFGNPQPFFHKSTALGECAQLGMARGELGTGVHGGWDVPTETLVALHPFEGGHRLPEAVDRPPLVALGLVSCATGEVC